MSRRLEDLDPHVEPLARRFVADCYAVGLPVIVTQTRRTLAEQATLYAQGRTLPGKIVTNAKPGQSPHNFGLAFDTAFIEKDGGVTWEPPEEGAWEMIGSIGERLGLVWGGNFKSFPDRPHFEFPHWREVSLERG